MRNYIENNQGQGIFEYPLKDTYCFYYPNCGKNRKGKSTDYFEVISLVNTANIITMYPVSFNEKLNICDIASDCECLDNICTCSYLDKYGIKQIINCERKKIL